MLVLFVAGACTGPQNATRSEERANGTSPSEAAPSPLRPWAKLEARPLDLPFVHPGSLCPKTTRGIHAKRIHEISSVLSSRGPGIALGSGPVYPMFFFATAFYRPSKTSGKGSVIRPANQPGTTWDSIKTMWIAAASFQGRLLVRGRQIDGLHRLRFGAGNGPGPLLLRLSLANAAFQRDGSLNWTGGTWARAPGCYVLQLDFVHASKIIVIEIGQPYTTPNR